jgi:stage III sporulation protein AE
MVMALLPPLTALMASSGSPGASAALNPMSTFLIGALQQAVTVILVPLALGVTALGIAENFNKSLNLEGITDFVKKTFTYLCGILITVMLGTLVVQGVMAKSLDSITVKTAKYAMKNMIPIAGGFFSDTFDTVMACSGLMKNALGVMGMLILASMALAPMLDMLVFILSLRLCGALSKLAGEGEKNSVFDRTAEGADMLMIALGGSMVMLVVIIGIFLTMGGVATG